MEKQKEEAPGKLEQQQLMTIRSSRIKRGGTCEEKENMKPEKADR